jgi:hypothetical protein
VVAACSPCNLRKGNLTTTESKMWPSQMPIQPTVQHLHRNGRLFPPNYLHDSWMDYLYWDTELDRKVFGAHRDGHGRLGRPFYFLIARLRGRCI